MTTPNQPTDFKFPKRKFGKVNPQERSFSSNWYKNHSWLHYDESEDLAFCFVCMEATKHGRVSNSKAEGAFISSGFSNWKDATVKFRKHQDSDYHKESVQRHVTLPKETRDIGETLSAIHSEEKKNNRKQLLTILRNIRFLARQGLAVRGHEHEESNFIQILKVHGETDESVLKWLDKKTDKFTSGDMQNEMLQIMALGTLRKVAANIRDNGFFTIMADETTDQSNREQVVIVIRHVDSEFNVHEEFIGLYVVPSIDSSTLTEVILDTLTRMNITLSKCRGQCYDGASNMSGSKNGVAANIIRQEERAVYTHCYGHALNLAIGDTMKKSKVMRDSLDTVHEISKLIKYSPRNAEFNKLKSEISPDTPGFRVLCPTRWTVRAASLCSVLDNYNVLQCLWDRCYELVKDSETRARVIGVQTMMTNFDFLFGVCLGYEILRHTDNLSKALQHKQMSATEGQQLAKLTIATLTKMREDESYDEFYEDTTSKLDSLDVNEPRLPRRRKLPKRFETGNAPNEYPTSEKELYRQKYYEALDLTINCIKDRFDQKGYKTYQHLEDLILKSVSGDSSVSDDIDFVVEFYKDDVEKTALLAQLESLKPLVANNNMNTNDVTIKDIVKMLREMKPASRTMFSEIVTVLKLILVMPATNATSERSFSALRRVKT